MKGENKKPRQGALWRAQIDVECRAKRAAELKRRSMYLREQKRLILEQLTGKSVLEE